MALHALIESPQYDVRYLLTSVSQATRRVAMHGVRIELLQKQFDAIGMEYGILELPEIPSDADYAQLMTRQMSGLKQRGFECAAFGDIFLEDLRQYRENQLRAVGFGSVFPLWKQDSKQLMSNFIAAGFKAIVVCVDATKLDVSFLGRLVDADFVNSLPVGVDACGENGEYHTFCFDAPYFRTAVPFKVGEKVYKEYKSGGMTTGFWFCDLLPLEE